MPIAMNTFLPGIRIAPRGFRGGGDAAVGIDAGLRGVGESSLGENNRGTNDFAAGFFCGVITAGATSGVTTRSGGLSYIGE